MDSFELYKFDIGEIEWLTKEDDLELGRKISEARAKNVIDVEAEHRLVTAHLPLVVAIAKKVHGLLSLEERIAIGNLALVKAVEGYDPSKNTRFSTYAGVAVRRAIIRASVAEQRHIITFASPTDEEQKLLNDFAENNSKSALSQAIINEHIALAEWLLTHVPIDDREYVQLRFMEQMGAMDIAAMKGIHRSAVNQRLQRAMKKMREVLNINMKENDERPDPKSNHKMGRPRKAS
jgi:RNA polymerase sigma factor (sigma-70 family)